MSRTGGSAAAPQTGRTPAQPDAEHFALLARRFAAEPDRDGVLALAVEASVARIPGAEHAGVTIRDHRCVSTPVATADVVREIDAHQYALAEGPCVGPALHEEHIVRADDLADDPRWPRFGPAAVALGVRSMLSFLLYSDPPRGTGGRAALGALNVYAAAPGAFTDASVRAGALLGAHAAVAAAATARSTDLRLALESRDAIGQAKGILMQRYRIPAEQAFDLLVAASQVTHRTLRDVAAEFAATGELDLGRS